MSTSSREEFRDGGQGSRLLNDFAWPARIALCAALGLATAANIAALLVPFMEISEFLHKTESYELPEAVKLMWTEGLPVVAVLIVSFSIVFPFAKLLGLAICLLPRWRRRERRARLLRLLAELGRWSLLDVFVVMLLMVLASDQWAVGTDVKPGIYLFMSAIGTAMAVSDVLASRARALEPTSAGRAEPSRAIARLGWFGRIGLPLLLLASLATLVGAIATPFLKIEQFLLRGFSYSVFGAIRTLWESHREVFATLMALLLAALPAVRLVLLAVALAAKASDAVRSGLLDWAGLARRWSGIEVFGLALLLVLVEGRSLIKTEVLSGAWILLGAIAANTALTLAFSRLVRGIRGGTA
jgi:paraquat-inducible protein A